MTEFIAGPDRAAEAEMVRAAFAGTILFLEGDSDALILDKFVDPEHCYIIVADGKEPVIDAVSLLEADGFQGVLGIVDADFDRVRGVTSPSPNVLSTDFHDFELMLFESDATSRVLAEIGSSEKLKRLLAARQATDIRSVVLTECFGLGVLRLVSIEEPFNLKFEDLSFKGFVDAPSFKLDLKSAVRAVVAQTQQAGLDPQSVEARVRTEMASGRPLNPYEVCCGHDVMEVFAIGLRRAIGSQEKAVACREHIERVLRLAYSFRDFAKSQLYGLIRTWETTNQPYRVLVA